MDMSAVVNAGPSAALAAKRPEPKGLARPKPLRGSCEPIEIGLINNMPDAALEGAERQFAGLLSAAAQGAPARLTCFSLPGIFRTEKARRYVSERYASLNDLWESRLDALIITGTEPQASDLRDEPFWASFREVLDWAEGSAISTISSCLAAHAAVLHIDGIARRALPDKCLGFFDHEVVADHPAVAGLASRVKVAHSRWNEVDEHALLSCGYQVLTRSAEAGVDLFVKQRKALFLFFQGHPEYESGVLLKEYRRDVGRFLRAERKAYPNMPRGYFDASTMAVLARFRERAIAQPEEALLAEFPAVSEAEASPEPYGPAAKIIYRNWLSHIVQRKAERRFSRS